MNIIRIHYLEHAIHETPGLIAEWAHERGHHVSGTRLYAEDPFPTHEYFDMLVILGGPMSVHNHDQYPWLRDEKHFIEKAIEANMPILGICLGAQLLADVLGADVYPMLHKEIGFYPVSMTAEGTAHPIASALPHHFTTFHWHGETFSIPQGAHMIARSNACLHQGFTLGDHIIALQFHPEITPTLAEKFVVAGESELEPGVHIQEASTILETVETESLRAPLFDMLDRMASRVAR